MRELTRAQAIDLLGTWAVETVERLDPCAVFDDRWEAILADDFGNEIKAVYYPTDDMDDDWEVDHFEIEGDIEQRYWIQKERIPGDTYVDILPAGTTEDEAMELAQKEWEHLTPCEQKHSEVKLCIGSVDVAQNIADPFGFGYDAIIVYRTWH